MIFTERNGYKYHHTHEHSHGEGGHTHEHTHTHTHEHEHGHGCCGHSHDHEISVDCDSNLSKEEKTLKVLLDHWVEHNKSHEAGFKEWVEKAKSMGKIETSECIQKAIEFMEKADEMLMEAKKTM